MIYRHFNHQKIKKNGFTIVELMIATAVFSLALLVLAVSLLTINHQYFKGISQGNVQTAASNILNNVTSAVEFSNGSYIGKYNSSNYQGYFCVGHTEFLYQLYKIDNNLAVNPLTEINNCIGLTSNLLKACSVSNCQYSGLLGSNMQLLNFQITSIDSSLHLFKINLDIAFSSKDQLFCSLSNSTGTNQLKCNPFNSSAALISYVINNPTKKIFCVPNNPVEFCSIQRLLTVVSSRYNNYE